MEPADGRGHGTVEAGAIETTEWRLVAWRRAGGSIIDVPDDVTATAIFGDGRIMGSTGCNRYVGTCTLDGGSMRLSAIAATLMACPPPQTAVEAGFLAALDRVVGVTATAERLELVAADGSVLLRFVPRPATPLIATAWSAIGVNNGRGAVSSLVAGSRITATFGTDGRVTGNAGCNDYLARYELDGARLRIVRVVAKRSECADPEVGRQEASFLAALERVGSWWVEGDRLELRSDDGALQADFGVDEDASKGG